EQHARSSPKTVTNIFLQQENTHSTRWQETQGLRKSLKGSSPATQSLSLSRRRDMELGTHAEHLHCITEKRKEASRREGTSMQRKLDADHALSQKPVEDLNLQQKWYETVVVCIWIHAGIRPRALIASTAMATRRELRLEQKQAATTRIILLTVRARNIVPGVSPKEATHCGSLPPALMKPWTRSQFPPLTRRKGYKTRLQ
ncbi:unnamed protein product, partial [Ectocarpus sp. 6 AP-2014]